MQCIAGPWTSDGHAPGCLQLCPSREAFFAKIKLPPGADLMQQLQVSRVLGPHHQGPRALA